MATRSDHSNRRSVPHWIADGFVALAVISCASYNTVREFGDRREVVVASREILPGEKITAAQLTITPVPNGSGTFGREFHIRNRRAHTTISRGTAKLACEAVGHKVAGNIQFENCH